MSLQGKVYAVTAAGQGIGLHTARVLASRGATLSLADSNPHTLAEVEKEFKSQGWPVLTANLDIRNREETDRWIEKTVETFGRLDGAANVAGVIGKQWGKASVAEIDDEDWNFVMAVNVTGTMNCLRSQLNHISNNGSIVNISSNQGSRGEAGCSTYVTSKHAIIGLTRCAAREYGRRGIRVNAVGPGPTKTPLFNDAVGDSPPEPYNAIHRFGEPDEIAYLIAWLLGPESTFVTGELYRADGGEFC